MRPNTEDFLTFLCFRGTSTLPKELDFTNSLSNQPSTSGTASTTRVNSSNNDKKKQDKTESNSKKKVINSTSIKSNSNNAIKLANNNKNDEETKATSDKEKKNEEGLSQTSTAEKKETKKSFMPFAVRKRAEIHPVRNDKKKAQTSNNTKKKQSQTLTQKEHKVEIINDNKESQSEQQRVTRSYPIDEKDYKSSKSLSNNKRRSQNNEESSDSYALNTKNIKLDKSPRIELTPIEKVPIEILKKDSKINVNVKKKIQNSDDVKRQTRLSALRNPAKSMTEKDEMFKNDYKIPSSESEKYFSSSDENNDDDDKPLLKSDSKISSKKKKKMQTNKKNASNSTFIKNKGNSKNSAIKVADESQPVVKTNKKKETEQNIKEKEVATLNDKLLENASKAESNKTVVESTSLPEKKKVGRKRKTPKVNVKDKDHSQANTTDLSENETRSRPMRKTKEAATIYMELIGRKLTLHDSSDNDSSLDSLEVPNLKRVELLENELKANVGKAKEAEAERKKNEEKKVI